MPLVIFDCDGVLVDSEIIAHELLAEMMADLGHPMSAAESIQKFAGRSLSDTLWFAQAILGRKIPNGVGERYGQLLLERLRCDLKPIPGVATAVAALPYRRCVASSSSFERIRLSLEVTGLAALFVENIFSASQVAHGKPAPDLYLLAANTMAVAPHDCIVVEDSGPGVSAGVAAGMTVIGFTGAAHSTANLADRLAAAGARRVIAAMTELPKVITDFCS